MPSITCASSFPINSLPGFVAGPFAGNVIVPSFGSTYCMLGNSSLSHPSLFGSNGLASGALPATSQFFSPGFFFYSHLDSLGRFFVTQTFCRRPRTFFYSGEAGYKIKAGKFIDLANLLPDNVKAQDSEPQTYMDGKLLVSTKKRVPEITDIVTWVTAFTAFMWILCCTHRSRWQDMTQYKLLILQTAHQFSGKAWLHNDTAFRKDAAASGLTERSVQFSYPLTSPTTVPASHHFILTFKITCLFI